MNTIGFIGLGNMGTGMSINLLKNGIKVLGYDINKDVYKNFKNHKISWVGI